MGRRGRPTHGPAVRSRITRLKARIPDLTIDAIHGQLEAEGLEVSRSFVGKVIKEWQNLDEHVKWLELPFEWRLKDRAGVPWEASWFLLDCQRFYESDYFREAYESPWVFWLDTLTELRLLTSRAKVTKPVRYYKLLAKIDPFTNRWACWSWRVHLAAPKLEPAMILPIARIYAAFEQLAALVTDKPPIDLAWLDTCLRELAPFEAVPLPQGGLGENTADLASKLIELTASAREARIKFLEFSCFDRHMFRGVETNLFYVYSWIHFWWHFYYCPAALIRSHPVLFDSSAVDDQLKRSVMEVELELGINDWYYVEVESIAN